MAIDQLQAAIRRRKNPSMVAFYPDKELIPPDYLTEATDVSHAYGSYAKELLPALVEVMPAVRFCFGSFAVLGGKGLDALAELIRCAKALGFYVLLDVPEIYAPRQAVLLNQMLPDVWEFDGLLLNAYIGSEAVIPFAEAMKSNDKDLFLALRTANKSAAEVQDLLTGSRLVYTAVADMAKRLGENLMGRKGYSRIAGVGPATSGENLRILREKYPSMFLLVDGYDYSGANAKNCSFAFDKLGHGAVVCAGSSVLGAWRDETGEPVALAVEAAQRMKKNLMRYTEIL